MRWPVNAGQLNFLHHHYCAPGLRPVTRSISDTDGKAEATGSSFAADGVAGGGFAAAVADTGGGSRTGGGVEAGAGGEASAAAGCAGGIALGAAG